MVPPGHDDASVGLLLIDDRGWVLLQLRDGRATYPYTWGTVGGRIEAGKTLESALSREVMEVTGYRVSHPVVFGASATIVLPDGRRRFATLFVGRYDSTQPIRCYEGLRIEFVDPATLDDLPIYPNQKALIQEALGSVGCPPGTL